MPQSGGVARWIGRLRYHVVSAMMARTPPASLVNVNGKLYGTTFYGRELQSSSGCGTPTVWVNYEGLIFSNQDRRYSACRKCEDQINEDGSGKAVY